MKLITPLWSDPVGWADQVAKTKLRVLVWIFIHLLFVSAGIVAIHWFVQKMPTGSPDMWFAVLSGACPIVFIGIVYPAMYLYAMHRLLKIVRGGARPDGR